MTSIIHISDPHAESRTMRNLTKLAIRRKDCDVIALTGDCTSSTMREIPAEWNEWPQRYKLAVPGNHDDVGTYASLTKWICGAPWKKELKDLTFVGLDTATDVTCENVNAQLRDVSASWLFTPAVVVLLHQWPTYVDKVKFGALFRKYFRDKPSQFLHGHNHPSSFIGYEWHEREEVGEFCCYRSRIYSAKQNSGLAHRIVWEEGQFSCELERQE
jgi:3',5'-cyclic AMP phosphodiesterase CpdA